MEKTQNFEIADAHKAFDVPDPFTNTKGDGVIPEGYVNSQSENYKWVLHGKEYRPIKMSGGFMEGKGHGLKEIDTFYLDDKNPDPKTPNKRSAGGYYNIGIDYVLGGDKLVVPWYGGTIEKAGLNGGYGYSVTVKTDHSYEYGGKQYPVMNTYSHLEYVSNGISEGIKVDTDTFIGKMGGTGRGGVKRYDDHVDFQSYIEVDGKKIQISPNLMQNDFIRQLQQGTFYEASNTSVNQASPERSIAMQRGTNLTRDTLATPHPSPLSQGEREQETSFCAPAPLLPPREKGLGDEGLSMLFMGSLSRFELIPMQRYEAIAEMLEQGGIQRGGSDWNRAVVQTAIGTDLDIKEVKDIAREIPGISPSAADQLVDSNAKNAQAQLT